MSDPNNAPEQTPEQTPGQAPETAPVPEPEPERSPISEKKKNALLRYMAILFGVAFLLVLLSFLIQMRDSRQQISVLNQSNASALQNAGKLQSENEALTEQNAQLQSQIDSLTERVKTAASRADVNAAELQQAKKDLSAAQSAAAGQKNDLSFLCAAADSLLSGDLAKCEEALGEIGEDRFKDDGNALALYRLVTSQLAAQKAAQNTTVPETAR